MVNSPIKAEDLATEFSVVRNEFEIGRELARARALAADDGRGLRVAQLRQVRRSATARTSSAFPPTACELLQEVLPARQRHAGRRRQVRREEGARLHQQILRLICPGRSESFRATYTEEPPAGRRTVVTLRRVGDVGLVGVLYPCPVGRRIPSFPRCELLAEDSRRRALGPAVQGAGGNQEGLQRLDVRSGVARPGRDRDRRGGQHQGPGDAGEGPRHDHLGAGQGCSRPGSPRKKSIGRGRRSSRIANWPLHDPNRIAIELSELGRAGRLAALLPQPRPGREGHGGRRFRRPRPST